MTKELKLFSGTAHRALAAEIAQYLKLPLGDADVTRFSDGEVFVQINENVRGTDVFVIQPTCPPVNDTLMELLIMIDAFKRASAGRITAVDAHVCGEPGRVIVDGVRHDLCDDRAPAPDPSSPGRLGSGGRCLRLSALPIHLR